MGDAVQLSGILHDTGVCGVDPVDVGEDLAYVSAHGGAEGSRNALFGVARRQVCHAVGDHGGELVLASHVDQEPLVDADTSSGKREGARGVRRKELELPRPAARITVEYRSQRRTGARHELTGGEVGRDGGPGHDVLESGFTHLGNLRTHHRSPAACRGNRRSTRRHEQR